MAVDLNVVKSYLVSLGFEVKREEFRKAEEALRALNNTVASSLTGATGIAGMFATAGSIIGGVLIAVAAGTVGLMEHVSDADLGFQVMARRMFLSTDAAKHLKIATDALGYSLDDVIWGPQELQERFGALIALQDKMERGHGPDYEKRLKSIRDITFRFTELNVELQYLAQDVVSNLSKALFGDDNALSNKLGTFIDWLRDNSPAIAEEISTKLAPVMADFGRVLADLWKVAKDIPWVKIADDVAYLADKLALLADYWAKNGIWGDKFKIGNMPGLPTKSDWGKINDWRQKNHDWLFSGSGAGGAGSAGSIKDNARAVAESVSQKTGIPASLLFGQFVHETGHFTNRGSRDLNNFSGINVPGGHGQDYRSFSSPQEFAAYYAHLLHRMRYREALSAKTPEEFAEALKDGGYYTDHEKTYAKGVRRGAEDYQSMSTGDIHINITQPNASTEQIHQAVVAGVHDAMTAETQKSLLRHSGAHG